MKTAVLISGQARTFRHCFANQYWMVLRHLESPDFFVSVADDADADAMELLRSRFFNVQIERVPQPDIPEPVGNPAFHAPNSISSPVQGILKQLWHLERVFDFARPHLDNYGRVVRLRPDLWFHDFRLQRFDSVDGLRCSVPWWGRYGGVNDRFAIMGAEAAPAYFRTFSQLDDLLARGCPLHPESLVAASLELGDVWIDRTLNTHFSALRPTGEIAWPDMQLYDIVSYLRSTA